MQVNCKLYFFSYLLIRVRKAFFEWGAGKIFFIFLALPFYRRVQVTSDIACWLIVKDDPNF